MASSPAVTAAAHGTARPVVLVLPAFDEEASVAAVVGRVPARVLDHPVAVIVVDDGSTDATAALAAEAGAHVERLDRHRGLGAAVRHGFATALTLDPAAVAFCDADGEYAPEELANVVGPVLSGQAEYVIGSRFGGRPRHMRPHRDLGNRILTIGLRALAKVPLTDGQSGYRALSPAAARDAEIIHDYNYAQVLTLDLVAKGFRYAEVPISYRTRQHGRSFVRLPTYLREVGPAVASQLRAHPIGRPVPADAPGAAPLPS